MLLKLVNECATNVAFPFRTVTVTEPFWKVIEFFYITVELYHVVYIIIHQP